MDISESFKKMATPESNDFSRRMAFGLEDSGYLSATPGSAGFQRRNALTGSYLGKDDLNIPGWQFSVRQDTTSARANLANAGLYTPDMMNAATKKRSSKCTLKKYKSFPVSSYDFHEPDFQTKHEDWSSKMVNDDSFLMTEDFAEDPNNFSMYDLRNVVNDDSMDVGDFPDSLELGLEDELYNDRVIEKVHARNKSIGVNTEDGMQLLHMKLTAVQLATQSTSEGPVPSWRNHYGHNYYPIISENMSGKKRVDFFSLLAIQSEHTHIVGKILGYLSPKDLNAVAQTSDDYSTILKTNEKANSRLNKYRIRQAREKENLQQKKLRPTLGEHSALSEIANVMGAAALTNPVQSPPLTPTKRRFQSFVRAARNVKPGDQLTECPRCAQPATVDGATNGGKCGRLQCGYEFCTICRRDIHLDSPCAVLDSPQAKRIRMMVRVGSKQSKRNLQRL